MKHKQVIKTEVVSNGHASAALHRFFSYTPHPFAIQDLMATLAAKRLLSVELLPSYLLPHALLLHAIAPEPGAVDDPVRLTERLLEEYDYNFTGGHGPRWWHVNGNLVAGLVHGTCSPDALPDIPDAQYIHLVYSELTHEDSWRRMFAGLPVKRSKV